MCSGLWLPIFAGKLEPFRQKKPFTSMLKTIDSDIQLIYTSNSDLILIQCGHQWQKWYNPILQYYQTGLLSSSSRNYLDSDCLPIHCWWKSSITVCDFVLLVSDWLFLHLCCSCISFLLMQDQHFLLLLILIRSTEPGKQRGAFIVTQSLQVGSKSEKNRDNSFSMEQIWCSIGFSMWSHLIGIFLVDESKLRLNWVKAFSECL